MPHSSRPSPAPSRGDSMAVELPARRLRELTASASANPRLHHRPLLSNARRIFRLAASSQSAASRSRPARSHSSDQHPGLGLRLVPQVHRRRPADLRRLLAVEVLDRSATTSSRACGSCVKPASRDWRASTPSAVARGHDVLAWDAVRHVVIIPNYKESTQKLRSTLQTPGRGQGRRGTASSPSSRWRTPSPAPSSAASSLRGEFEALLLRCPGHLPPSGLPGEVRGKSSNEAWAARRCSRRAGRPPRPQPRPPDGDELRRRHAVPASSTSRP